MKGIEQISNNKFKVLYGHTIIGNKVGFIYSKLTLKDLEEALLELFGKKYGKSER